jgi:hypothetical protein
MFFCGMMAHDRWVRCWLPLSPFWHREKVDRALFLSYHGGYLAIAMQRHCLP